MTLRNGKAVAKEMAQATTSVDGAMETMTITPEEDSQTSVSANSVEMEIDDGVGVEAAEVDSPVTVESVREHVTALGVIFREKTQNKMVCFCNRSRSGGGSEYVFNVFIQKRLPFSRSKS